MTRPRTREPVRQSLTPEVAIRLLKVQRTAGEKFLSEKRFTESEIEPWQSQTIHILEQAFGTQSYGLYAGAFMNWQSQAIAFGDDEEELYAEDARRALPKALNTLDGAIAFLEETAQTLSLQLSSQEHGSILKDPQTLYDSLRLHSRVVSVSKKLFHDGHYAEAIFAASKEVILAVREVSGLSHLDGTPLMEQAFSPNGPKIKLNSLSTRSEKDEQLGFMNIFSGLVLGIRNPKAHDNIKQPDPYKTLEYLSLASLLLKRIDERTQGS